LRRNAARQPSRASLIKAILDVAFAFLTPAPKPV
jgi:hypothetical protein